MLAHSPGCADYHNQLALLTGHRIQLQARGATGSGRALLFLLPQELGFLKYLRTARVTMNEYEFPDKKVANVQAQLEKLVAKNYYLNRSARDAYRAYMLSYASHSLKHIFNVTTLDLTAVSRGFGFDVPPRVNLVSVQLMRVGSNDRACC